MTTLGLGVQNMNDHFLGDQEQRMTIQSSVHNQTH
jgi:hypothetical protein